MTDAEPRDPRAMDDAELAQVPDPPRPDDPDPGQGVVADDEGAPDDPEGAQRPGPAGEDYAGSGF